MENHNAGDIYLKPIGSSEHLEQFKCPIRKSKFDKNFCLQVNLSWPCKTMLYFVEVIWWRHYCCESWHFISGKTSTSSYLIS